MQLRGIFVVIDPTTPDQIALARAAAFAGHTGASIHAYICIPETYVWAADGMAMRAAERARHELWLASLVRPLLEQGLTVTTEVECHDDWRSALAPAADRAGADLVVKETRRHSPLHRHLLKTSDWTLLRHARCPVMLVKSRRLGAYDHVLAAINFDTPDAFHQALADSVIEHARALAASCGSELHAVDAYESEQSLASLADMARRLGIDRTKVHTAQGDPETVISEVARRLGSPLVVMSTVARRGVSGAILGNTAERALDALDCDVLIIIRRPG